MKSREPRRRTAFDYPDKRIAYLKHDEKLTVEQVDEIRRRYRHHSRHANYRVLAEEFEVSTTTIFNIVRERKWRFDNWQFRERSQEPRNEKYTMTKAELKAMKHNIMAMLALEPDNPKAIEWYERYLLLQAHYNRKRG